MPETIIYPQFISNLPCGKDLFQSGSQEQTCNGISDYIKGDNNDLRLIGLDGEWGSGKSNAIKIIDARLGEEFHTFIYDTWAHQEDLQRRSFLEELTYNLEKNHLVDQLEWREKLKTLLAKKKEITKKTIPKLSIGIIVSIFVVILMPFVNALSELTLNVFYKIILTLSPLIIALVVWIYYNLTSKKGLSFQELFYIYKEKDLEENSEETISESEPSVTKFNEWLLDLSNAISKNKKGTKNVIVVFDNMDRLPPEKVKIIWALIHTFFTSSNFKNIWIIVPFDRSHIREAFGNEGNDNEYEKTNQFISKTFPIIFNISPIVLTDWKDFFEEKFKEAFGETEKEEFNITRKIFDLYNTSITPRKIIAFLNDLVSLRLISQKNIKLRYIAVFVLNKQRIAERPLHEILNKEFLSRSQNLFANDDLVSDNIASLLYNIPLEKATQVSLQREIEIAIRENRNEDLKEFSKNSDFLSILDQIRIEDFEINNITTCLNEIESSMNEPDKEAFQVIWDRVVGRQININVINLEFTETHKILILKARVDQRKRLVKYIIKQFNQLDFSGSKYYNGLSDLENYLKDKGISIDCVPMIDKREVEPEKFVDFVKNAEENYEKYKVLCKNDSLEKYFLDKVPNDLKDASVIWNLKNHYKFPKLKEALEKIIKSNEVILENVFNVFDTYKAVSLTKFLIVKLSDSKISELLNAAKENSGEYYELSAMRLARGSNFVSTGAVDKKIIAKDDEKFIEEVSLRIEYYNYYGTMLLNLIEWPQPSINAILKHLTLGTTLSRVSIEAILPHFSKIISTIDVTEEELFKKLDGWKEDLKEELTTDNLEEIIPEYEFYNIAVKFENDLTRNILEVSIKYIENASLEQWDEAFKNENSYLFNLLVVLLKTNKINNLPDNAFAEYKESLKSIANEPGEYNIGSETLELWLQLYTKSDHLHLQPTIKNIRDIFLRDIDITAEQFLFFETLFRELGGLEEKAGDVVRKILVPVIRNNECFNAISENTLFYATLIYNAGNDAFDFIDILRDKIESNEESEKVTIFSNSIHEKFTNDIKIIYACYYSDRKGIESGIDITMALKRIVEKEKNSHFIINNGIVNNEDPDSGNPKKLYVKYSYKSEEKEKTFDEHKWLRLP